MPELRWPVVLLPGGVTPVGLAYAALLEALGPSAHARPKDLEVYAAEAPPADYSLATEVAGITRVADDVGLERLHLVGYSAGGAASLAFAERHPERVASLALLEPAFAGWHELSDAERSHMERFRPLLDRDGPAMFADFQSLQVAPGVDPALAPPGPPPPWMATRPAGIRAILRSFFGSDLDVESLRRFDRPVLYVLGGRSHPDYYALMADRLAGVFTDFTLEVFPDRHHFDPPHRIEPARLAAFLRSMWTRADRR